MEQLSRMLRLLIFGSGVFALAAHGHTLFLKSSSFFVPLNQDVVLPIINGTFVKNENKVIASRLTDTKIVGPDGDRVAISNGDWMLDDSGQTSLVTRFAEPGTYLVGAGTRPMMARMSAEDFTFYLRYEGLIDDLRDREQRNEHGVAAAERYSKFAKAIIQAGEPRTDNFNAVVGHPIEIVPLENPYKIEIGQSLRVRVLRDGLPVANELVYASHEGHYEADSEGIVDEAVSVRTDDAGLAVIPIGSDGLWYVRVIDLVRIGASEHWYSGILVTMGVEEPRVLYESRWATLTFEIQ